MAAVVHHHVIVCFFCLIAVTSSSSAEVPQPLVYRIFEEQTPGTQVADVARDAHITTDSIRPHQQQTRPNSPHRQPAQGGGPPPNFQILQNQTNFVIDPQTGSIRTAAILDRDSICPRKKTCRLDIDVAVYARRGSSPSLVKVIFDLLDLNDNSPVFPKPFVVETVSEATLVGPGGLPFFVLPADDLDSPANGVVRYRMESDDDDGTFGLAVETGDDEFQDIRVVLNQPLDREKRDRYRIRIFAIDGGGGGTPRSGSTTIQIDVGDVNDNAPVFTSASYRAEVTENSPPQPSLLTVSAGDADSGPNGRVTYSLSAKTAAQHGSTFSVDSQSGVISLLTPVDYERTKQFVLEVVAVDGGELPIPATARVNVEVRDENDNSPEIRLESATVQSGSHSHPVLYVTENSPSNHYVALLAVNDADSGTNGRVNCSLSGPQHHHQQFQLVQITDRDFKIVTGDSLIDRESVDRHDLNVTCTDRGSPRRTAGFPIVVVVEDLNDNKPVFLKEFYNFSIEENNRENAFVGQISAVDADNEKNGQVEYRIQQNASAWFSLDPKTGSLRALRRFDREANESFRFVVYASDFGPERWHSNALVQVDILDQDDEGPRFTHKRYVFNITDDLPSLTEIGQVIALDRDQPPRNRFTFYLDTTKPVDTPFPRPPPTHPSSPGVDSTLSSDLPFGINLTSGVVYTRDRVSRRRRSEYDFSVVVRSRSDPPRKDRAQVVVHVNDPVLGRVGGGPTGSAVPLLGVWWRGALKGIGWVVFVGALALTGVVVVVVVVFVASIRRRRTTRKRKKKQTTIMNEAATRSASFWSNPDALTPPPPPELDAAAAGKGGKAAAAAAAGGEDVYASGGRRRVPSSSTDDASYNECPNGNTDTSQCHWCSSTELPPMSATAVPFVVYDNHAAVPGDARSQNLGNCGFRPIGDATGGGHWRERYLTATPPGEYRRQPYSANSSPMHMASTYQIRHPSRPAGGGGGGGGGGGSGTLERRTVRFQGNADNDFRRMYGDLAVNPACVAIGNDAGMDQLTASQS